MQCRKCVCFLIFFSVFILGRSEGAAVFRFANIYGNHMVLQQAPRRATIWGFGEVGQEVELTAAGEVYRSLIRPGPENSGIWVVLLKPQVFGGPYTINAYSVVKGSKVTASLEDVLFGDVWICSGQSNMEFTVIMSDNGETAINESVHYQNIRLFTAQLETSGVPLMELRKVMLPWSIPSPRTVGGPPWLYFSAVCWYYAIQLYAKLKYPIGLVASTWGGTPIEAWSSPDALKKCYNTRDEQVLANPRWIHEEFSIAGPRQPSCLWNAMICPFLNMTIYGVAWYQGEENAQLGSNPYNCTFPAMIDDWRSKWYEGTKNNTLQVFPFGFVQLSACGHSITGQVNNFAPLRWNQTAQYGYVPNNRQKNVFMAVAMDLGNPNAPYGSVHPTDKKDVGIRLSLAGLSVAYGVNVYYTGPLLAEIQHEPQSLALKVLFRSVFDKIEVRSPYGFEVLCQKSTTWKQAKITSVGPESVIIMLPVDCSAKAVRYAWSDYPCVKKKCAIYSRDLPSPPFIKFGPF